MRYIVGLPTGQLSVCMACGEEFKLKITHILYGERKGRTGVRLHAGHSKTLGLVHTGEVGTLLAADVN